MELGLFGILFSCGNILSWSFFFFNAANICVPFDVPLLGIGDIKLMKAIVNSPGSLR